MKIVSTHIGPWEVYDLFEGKEDVAILFSLLSNEMPFAYREQIENYYRHTQMIKLHINGNDLKSLNISAGKRMGHYLKSLLRYEIENQINFTKEEEIKWIVSMKNEYRD